MITADEVKKLVEELKSYYNSKIMLQKEELAYYDDTFAVGIKQPYHIKRTGSGARVVDTMVEHITTSNPKVYRQAEKNNETANLRAARVARLANKMVTMFIQEIEEAVKNGALYGEGYFQVEYNPDWKETNTLPILITSPDPLTIFPDPTETNGVPVRFIKSMKVKPSVIKNLYPNWTHADSDADEVEYIAFFDKDSRYIESDNNPVSEGVEPNILGIVPLVHFYSGLGKTGIAAKPEDKAVGRLRKIKGRLVEECEIESRIDSIIGLWANPYGVFTHTAEGVELEEDVSQIDISPGHNIEVPFGIKFEVNQGTPPPTEMFRHLANIQNALGIETPNVALGTPSTASASGRQEDIYSYNYDRKTMKLVNNVERALSVALGMALRIIEKIHAQAITQTVVVYKDGEYITQEETISPEDIGGNYNLDVELKPDNEITQDRKIMLGRILVNEGRISVYDFLVEYMGKTQDEAEDIMNRTMAEKFYRENPLIADMIAREAVIEMGGKRYLDELEKESQLSKERQTTLTEAGPEMTRRMAGQAQRGMASSNPTSMQAVRQMLSETPYGVRKTPQPENLNA